MHGGVFNIIQSCKEALVLTPVLRRGHIPRAEVTLFEWAALALEHGPGVP